MKTDVYMIILWRALEIDDEEKQKNREKPWFYKASRGFLDSSSLQKEKHFIQIKSSCYTLETLLIVPVKLTTCCINIRSELSSHSDFDSIWLQNMGKPLNLFFVRLTKIIWCHVGWIVRNQIDMI